MSQTEPENFHQLRVWSRRADAALDLYADLIPTASIAADEEDCSNASAAPRAASAIATSSANASPGRPNDGHPTFERNERGP